MSSKLEARRGAAQVLRKGSGTLCETLLMVEVRAPDTERP